MDIQDFINAQLAKPMTHVVLTSYECGKVRRHETRSAAAAENWAIGERRKLGRTLVNRDAKEEVRVVSVEICAL